MGSSVRRMATLGSTVFVSDESSPAVRSWTLEADGAKSGQEIKPFNDGAPAGLTAVYAPRLASSAPSSSSSSAAAAGASGVVAGDPLLFAARTSLRMLRPSDGKPLLELYGHASEVRAVASSADGALVATAGSDGILNVWSVAAAVAEADRIAGEAAAGAGGVGASGKKKKKKRRRSKYEGVRASLSPAAALALPEPAERIVVLSASASGAAAGGAAAMEGDDEEEEEAAGKSYVVVALLRGGATHVVALSARLGVTGDAAVQGLGGPVRAAFLRGDSIVFVTGPGASPGTSVVPVFAAGGAIRGAVLRPEAGAAGGGGGAEGGPPGKASVGASSTRPDRAAAAAAAASGDAIAAVGVGGAMVGSDDEGEEDEEEAGRAAKRPRTMLEEVANGEEGPSIAERLAAMAAASAVDEGDDDEEEEEEEEEEDGDGSGNKTRSKGALAGTTAVPLAQAAQVKDDALLEKCLQGTRKAMVAPTVAALPPSAVLPLVGMLAKRFEATPGRGAELTPWLHALLTLHAGQLIGAPDLAKHLGPLYHAVDSRLSVFRKLLRLSGRLQMMLAQVEGTSTLAAAAAGGAGRRAARPQVVEVDF